MTIALTRAVSPRLGECELTHLDRQPIDVRQATLQHGRYEGALRQLGFDVTRVSPAPAHPDGVFVEDAAVVLDELAIVTRPGAASRRGEVESVAAALAPYRPLVRLDESGDTAGSEGRAGPTLDGGDVLVTGRTVYVGDSARTNAAGRARLRSILEPIGYDVRVVPVRGCLHLKTAVTSPAPGVFLLNPRWVPANAFKGRIVEVDTGEPFAANVLCAEGAVLCAAGAPRTRKRLESLGLDVLEVDVSEVARAEAGVTCCSLVIADAIPTDASRRHIPMDPHEEERR